MTGFLGEITLAFMVWRKAKKFKREEQSGAGAEFSAGSPNTNPVARFKATMRWEKHHDADLLGPGFNAWLEIEAEGADSVFIHHVDAVGAHFGSKSQAILSRWEDLRGGQSIKRLDGEGLPRRLTPGDAMLFKNPWRSYTPESSSKAWAWVRIHYSTSRAPSLSQRMDTVAVSL